jgi:hypothetical protein
MYTILAQRHRGTWAYYGQLERADHDTMLLTTVFKCNHRHRTAKNAEGCPDVIDARHADRVKQPSTPLVEHEPTEEDERVAERDLALFDQQMNWAESDQQLRRRD